MTNLCDISTPEQPRPSYIYRKAQPALTTTSFGFGLAPVMVGHIFGGLTPRDTSETSRVVEEWKASFDQLRAAQDRRNYNADVPLPDDDVVAEASRLLADIFEINCSMAPPEIVPDGQGGLDVESRTAERLVSIHIDPDRSEMHIFVKSGDVSTMEDFDSQLLETLFR